MSDYLEQSLAKLKYFEGCVPWMYRDTVGRVTVGVGLMLPDASAAAALPFAVDGRTATAQEIAAEFSRVHGLAMGHLPSFYKAASAMELSESTIDAKLSAVLNGFEGELRKRLPHYDGLPDGVKLAVLDMTYNLGPAGLLKDFPHFVAAIEDGSWTQAAALCMRRGPSAERNGWTREQLLSAVGTTIKAEAESWWMRLWHWIRLTLQRLLGGRA